MSKWSYEYESASNVVPDPPAPKVINDDEDPNEAERVQMEAAIQAVGLLRGQTMAPTLAEGEVKISIEGSTDAEATERSGKGYIQVRVENI